MASNRVAAWMILPSTLGTSRTTAAMVMRCLEKRSMYLAKNLNSCLRSGVVYFGVVILVAMFHFCLFDKLLCCKLLKQRMRSDSASTATVSQMLFCHLLEWSVNRTSYREKVMASVIDCVAIIVFAVVFKAGFSDEVFRGFV